MLKNKLAIASPSLGQHPSHTLPRKIVAAAQNGFSGLEITYPDLEFYSMVLSVSMLEGAQKIKKLCADNEIVVLSFASFQNFEGNTSPLRERLAVATEWLAITRALGAEHLQVPSSYDRTGSVDHQNIVFELRQLAELAAASSPVIKIAYENLAWSTHCTLWQEALEIVLEVARDNFGLCLDSFHIAVALWGDPFLASGRQENGDEKLEESMKAFVKTCPVNKIFYLQLSDGECMNPTYSESHPWYDTSLEPGHVWSNEARPFPLEKEYGAYMPIEVITRAFIVDIGFTGWVSLETFDRRMREKSMGPTQNARRAASSWRRLGESLRKNKSCPRL